MCVYEGVCMCVYVCINVCACIYVYIYVCACVYIYVYIYVCTHVYVCMHTCKCACVCMNVYVCVYTYVYICVYKRTCMCMYICMCDYECVCMYMYKCVCICVYVCMHVCASAHTHIYIRACWPLHSSFLLAIHTNLQQGIHEAADSGRRCCLCSMSLGFVTSCSGCSGHVRPRVQKSWYLKEHGPCKLPFFSMLHKLFLISQVNGTGVCSHVKMSGQHRRNGSLSLLWTPGIELESSGLAESTVTFWAILPTPQRK
jgi:nuclear pore complex protein Nup62